MGSLGKAVYHIGFWIRETGQALDRLGCRLQGIYAFQEQISRHRTLMNLCDKMPVMPRNAFVAPSAAIVGDVKVGSGSSIWYGSVLRGDINGISIGIGTNVQDNSLIHASKTNILGKSMPVVIGSGVTIGHSAVLHACTVEDDTLIGMGATLLDGVHVEKNAMVAAGAVVKENTRIPTGEVWAGNPAKFLRKLSEDEIAFFAKSAEHYSELAKQHAQENSKTYEEIQSTKVLLKKWGVQSEDYDSHIGVVHEKPPVHVTLRDPTTV